MDREPFFFGYHLHPIATGKPCTIATCFTDPTLPKRCSHDAPVAVGREKRNLNPRSSGILLCFRVPSTHPWQPLENAPNIVLTLVSCSVRVFTHKRPYLTDNPGVIKNFCFNCLARREVSTQNPLPGHRTGTNHRGEKNLSFRAHSFAQSRKSGQDRKAPVSQRVRPRYHILLHCPLIRCV